MKALVNSEWRNIEVTGENGYIIEGEIVPVENIKKVWVEDFEVSETYIDGEYPEYRLNVFGYTDKFDIVADGGADLNPADNTIVGFNLVSGEATDNFGNTFEVEFGECESANKKINGSAV